MIIDCHTHWGMVWEDRYRGDATAWLQVLDDHGIDQAFLMGHYSLAHSTCAQADNDRLAHIRDRHPERVVPFATVWPKQGREAMAEVRRCVEVLGMRGLKFHPWLQGFSTAEPVFGEICALAGELGVPVLFHDGTPCYSLPEQIGGLARRFPATTFILGHAGLLWSWRSAMETARLPNVWITLCGPHMRAVELLCQRVCTQRILWGTDFGFGFADPIGYRLQLIQRARLDARVRVAVLGGNARRLLAQV